jgi:hypothetical protein
MSGVQLPCQRMSLVLIPNRYKSMRPFKMNKNALLHKIKSTSNAIGTFNFFKHYSKLDRISFYLNHPYKKL